MRSMKKIIFLSFVTLCIIAGIMSVKTQAASKRISLNKTKYVMKKGKRVTLKASILKDKYKSKKILWSSSNKKVAKVSSKGSVVAKKNGTATITARISGKSGSKYKASCKIYVGTPVTSISLNKKKCELVVGKTFQIKATVKPSKATKKSVSYESSDKKIAKVSSSGKITAVKEGDATITVKSKDGNDKKVKITVKVLPKPEPVSTSEEKPATESTKAPDQNTSKADANPPAPGLNSPAIPDPNANTASLANPVAPSAKALEFLGLMEQYSAYIRQNGAYFKKNGSNDVYTFQKAKASVEAEKTAEAKALAEGKTYSKKYTYVNCTSPMNWGLYDLKIFTAGNIYGGKSGFHIGNSTGKANLMAAATFMKTGNGIGKGLPEAARAGYLVPGDMIAIYISSSAPNHSCVYKGLDASGRPMVYEAGGNAQSGGYNKNGCGPLNYSSYNNYTITEIIRFR